MADQPFVLGVVSDLSGASPGRLAFRDVDRDTFDDFMERAGVSIQIEGDSVSFRDLEDFHADSLLRRVPALRELWDARDKPDPTVFQKAETRPAAPAPDGSGSLLDAVLDAGTDPESTVRVGPLAKFLDSVAAGQLERAEPVELAAWRDSIDRALAGALRHVLWSEGFRARERAWRDLSRLVMESDTAPDLRIEVLDLSKRDLQRCTTGDGTELRDVFDRGSQPGSAPFGAVVVCHAFGSSDEDVATLLGLAEIGRATQCRIVASVAPRLLGVERLADLAQGEARERLEEGADPPPALEALRASPSAEWLALVLSGPLSRVPYGADGDPLASFSFEEIEDGDSPLLWGNGASALAGVLTQAYRADGWSARPEEASLLTGLPMALRREDGEARAVPCAEVLLTDKQIGRLADWGLTVLAPYRDMDQAQFFGIGTVGGTRLALGDR